MKKISLLALSLVLTNLAPAAFGQGYIYGIEKQHQFVQTGNSTVVDVTPDTYRLHAFVAGDGQDTSTPASTIFITSPSSANYSLAFNPDNGQWQYKDTFGNQTAMDAIYTDGTYGYTVGGNTGFITVSGNLYPNMPIATITGGNGTWFNGSLYVTPGANVTIASNIFTTNFISGQSRVGVQAEGQNTGLNFTYDSFDDPIPLTANSGNVTIPGTALLSGNMYDAIIEFNAFSQFQDPGINGGKNIGLYSMTTQFFIISGSVPVPEPSEYAMFAGVACLGAAWWRRRRAKA